MYGQVWGMYYEFNINSCYICRYMHYIKLMIGEFLFVFGVRKEWTEIMIFSRVLIGWGGET